MSLEMLWMLMAILEGEHIVLYTASAPLDAKA